jgi:hypothetical protein
MVGGTNTGVKVDTVIIQTTTVTIEKMNTSDSAVSILGEEFWISKSGKCGRVSRPGPLTGTIYSYQVSVIDDSLDYSLRITPYSMHDLSFRKLTGNKQ